MPGDLSASIESMADEGLILYKDKQSIEAKNYLKKLLDFNTKLIDWFHKKEKTEAIIQSLRSFNDSFLEFENIVWY